MRLIKYGPPKKRKGDVEEGQQENDEENDEDDQNEANNNQRSDEDDLNEDEQVESNKNEQVAEKKSFRKKLVKITPRNQNQNQIYLLTSQNQE